MVAKYMAIISRIALSISLLLTTGILASCHDRHQIVEDPQEWDYAYDYPPPLWGKAYPLCAEGGFQSPIDINSTDVTKADTLPLLGFEIPKSAAWLVNNGYAIEVDFKSPSGILTIGNKEYTLQEFHFHTPSETMIDGNYYPMELHWVYHAHNKWVVIAVFIQQGAANPALTQLWQHLPAKKGKTDISAVLINFSQLLPVKRNDYYRFEGSLTTPPCSRHIMWYVLKQPITASQQQIDTLHRLVGDNTRPTQPINERLIESTTVQ